MSRPHRSLSSSFIRPASLVFVFIAGAILSALTPANAQDVPCINSRSKTITFVDRSSPAPGACRNTRIREPFSSESGIDDFTVSGYVLHQNGVPLSGVTMTLERLSRNSVLTVVTGPEGEYFFNGLQIAERVRLTPSRADYTFQPESVTNDIVRNVVFNFTASGPPPTPPPPPANQPTLAWSSYYHNPPPSGTSNRPNADYHAMLARDAAGNVYVAGTSHRENYIDNGNTDITLFKTDRFGNRVWSRAFNGPGNYKDGAADIAVDPAGNVFIAGFAAVSTGSGFSYDYVVLKYDPDGQLLWARYYDNGGTDMPSALVVDPAGNAYVTGYSGGNFLNYATVKYDPAGNELWARRYAGGFGEIARAIELDAAGNVYVTGSSGHSVAGNAEDFLTVKYSAAGEQIWVNRYDAPGDGNDEPKEMKIASDGSVYIVGITDNFLEQPYTVIQKIDGAGKTVWGESFRAATGNNVEDAPLAMKLDPAGNIIIAGWIRTRTQTGSDYDAYVAKLDPAANPIWTKRFDGPGNDDYDGDTKLAVDASGNIYIAVVTEGFANHDIQVIKYLPGGETDWTYRFGNPYRTPDRFIYWIDDNAPTNILVDDEGGVYVAAESLITTRAYDLSVFKLEPAAKKAAVPFDFDGDGKADISVFRPETGVWYVMNSSDGTFSAVSWGLASDVIAPADFDGDGRTDRAVYRDGVWYVMRSSDNGIDISQFGLAGDVPIPADYDNDGKADLSVYRQNIWYTQHSTIGFRAEQFGIEGDIPVPSDYDSNRRTDIAIYRAGQWYVQYENLMPLSVMQFGISTDIPVPADYDGDKQTDHAVFRDGVWYISQSSNRSAVIVHWGIPTDIPVPADYDGDGKADIAVYRDGVWYVLYSTTGNYGIVNFGLASDRPVPAAFIR